MNLSETSITEQKNVKNKEQFKYLKETVHEVNIEIDHYKRIYGYHTYEEGQGGGLL